MRRYYPVLTVAGSDSSGGAGIQADIKTISALGGYAMTVISAITAQSTVGVTKILPLDSNMIRYQFEAVCSDIHPCAIKIGMIYDTKSINTIANCIKLFDLTHVVVDPVLISSSGSKLTDSTTLSSLITDLFPLAELVTPNIDEAYVITGLENPEKQAEAFHEMGVNAVLLKGGDSDNTDFKTDYLAVKGSPMTILKADAVNTINTHGTGCTLSAAIATYLAFGYDIETAVMKAKLFVTRALQAGSFVTTGKGHGPVNHFFSPRKLKSYNPDKYDNFNKRQKI